ncbi:hypothetical protein ACJBY5_10400, partial [Streptococcus suis]
VRKVAQHIAAKSDEEFDPRIREASADLLFDGNKLSTKNSQQSLYFDFAEHNQSHELAKGEKISFEQVYRLSRENDFAHHSYEELKA